MTEVNQVPPCGCKQANEHQCFIEKQNITQAQIQADPTLLNKWCMCPCHKSRVTA
jgi:hypothetical protein